MRSCSSRAFVRTTPAATSRQLAAGAGRSHLGTQLAEDELRVPALLVESGSEGALPRGERRLVHRDVERERGALGRAQGGLDGGVHLGLGAEGLRRVAPELVAEGDRDRPRGIVRDRALGLRRGQASDGDLGHGHPVGDDPVGILPAEPAVGLLRAGGRLDADERHGDDGDEGRCSRSFAREAVSAAAHGRLSLLRGQLWALLRRSWCFDAVCHCPFAITASGGRGSAPRWGRSRCRPRRRRARRSFRSAPRRPGRQPACGRCRGSRCRRWPW